MDPLSGRFLDPANQGPFRFLKKFIVQAYLMKGEGRLAPHLPHTHTRIIHTQWGNIADPVLRSTSHRES